MNVVIWRVPRGESVVRPASRCTTCDHDLSPAENVPVVSWLALRGRCRHCRAPISVRYPAVELVTGVLWAGVGARFADLPWAVPAYLVLSAGLVALSVIDLDHKLLPNVIVYPTGVGVGALLLIASAGEGEWTATWRALAAGAIYFALYFALWFVVGGRALGFGDVRLAAVLGLALGWLGWTELWWGIFLPFLIGSLLGMVLAAPWLLVPMAAAGAAGALVGVEATENWRNASVDDPLAARLTVGVLAAVLVGALFYLVASALRRVPRGRALPFGPSMAAGCLLVVLASGSVGL